MNLTARDCPVRKKTVFRFAAIFLIVWGVWFWYTIDPDIAEPNPETARYLAPFWGRNGLFRDGTQSRRSLKSEWMIMSWGFWSLHEKVTTRAVRRLLCDLCHIDLDCKERLVANYWILTWRTEIYMELAREVECVSRGQSVIADWAIINRVRLAQQNEMVCCTRMEWEDTFGSEHDFLADYSISKRYGPWSLHVLGIQPSQFIVIRLFMIVSSYHNRQNCAWQDDILRDSRWLIFLAPWGLRSVRLILHDEF
jgi:hypothetical protein